MNSDVDVTREYHEATKLSHAPSEPLRVDWSDQPRPYKLYRDLERIPLPRDLTASRIPALSAIAERTEPSSTPDLRTLATILHHSAGIVRRLRYQGGTMLFRAAPCTGALYHVELYVVCGPLPDLEAGVYHFGVHDFSLGRLRAGDFRGALMAASGEEPSIAAAPVIIACTSTFWRNAWRYQARSYRHSYWDNGTILANMLAMANAHGILAHVVTGFVDADVNRLLGVDGQREAALTLVALGRTDEAIPPSPAVEFIDPPAVPASAREVDYPLIQRMHAGSSLAAPAAVADWRRPHGGVEAAGQAGQALAAGQLIPLAPPEPAELATSHPEPVELVIARRGSARRFDERPIAISALSTMLTSATRRVPLDAPGADEPRVNDVYLVVHAVDGLESGAYVMTRDRQALDRLRSGSFRGEAAELAVSQQIAGTAAVNVFFLADLDRVGRRYGNRGYRVAQLEAAIMGGRLYLAVYALGLAASGLTFFDDEVTAFFSPHARGKSVMFLVAIGQSVSRRAGPAG